MRHHRESARNLRIKMALDGRGKTVAVIKMINVVIFVILVVIICK